MIIATHGIVASQILTVPVATAATSVGDSSFTANWNAYSGANYYLLDVSLNSSFSSFVGAYQNYLVYSTSQVVSGLSSNTTYYYRVRAVTGIDSDVASFITRVYTAGGTLSYTEATATEQLVSDLKGYSIWSKMKAIYPMVGASADACSQNLKSSSFTGTFTSGWTYASTGVTPNGTSAYMNTGFNASTNFSATSRSMTFYNRTNSAKGYDMGCNQSGLDTMLSSRYTGTTSAFTNFGSTVAYLTASTTATGFFHGNNISNTERLYKNGSQIATRSNTILNVNLNIYIGAANINANPLEFTDHQCAFASIGDGLDSTEASNFYTAVQTFNTTLSRQV